MSDVNLILGYQIIAHIFDIIILFIQQILIFIQSFIQTDDPFLICIIDFRISILPEIQYARFILIVMEKSKDDC